MTMTQTARSSGFKSFRSIKRKTVKLSQEGLIRTSVIDERDQFLLVVEPNAEDLNLETWAASHRKFLEEKLLAHGGILFRGFDVASGDRFHGFVQAISPGLLDYRERAAPRTEVKQGVYTSTEFPADQYIPLHHEMSYSHNWPSKIWFYCDQPPASGGRTPIACDRRIFKMIDPAIKRKFQEKKLMYVRNYGGGVDLPWQEAFQTDDKAEVEKYCRQCSMEFDWRGEDRLRTRGVRQAVVRHPVTGEPIWFNHAHMFHVSNLQPEVRKALLAEFAEDELPRNALYGDATPIEESILEEIRNLYREEAVYFPWQKGDVLMLDNVLASHGREPFEGPRKILVAMAELYTNPDI